MSNKNQTKTNQPQLTGILGIIERTGNKIPHPIYMFIAFSLSCWAYPPFWPQQVFRR